MPQKQIDAALLTGSFVSPGCSLPIISNNKQESNPITVVELNDHASRGQLSRIHDIGRGVRAPMALKTNSFEHFLVASVWALHCGEGHKA
jgi:hypothetical protein